MANAKKDKRPKVYSYPHNVSKETYDEMFEAWLDSSGTELTSTRIHNVLASAFDGYARDQASVFRNVIEKEISIAAHLQTRKLAVSGLPWSVVGSENSVKNKELEKILNGAGINSAMNHWLDASSYGYSGSFIEWGLGGGTIKSFPVIDHSNWEFDDFGNPYLMDKSGQRNALSETKNNVVYHQFNAKSGIPSTLGLCRTLIWTYFFKLFAFRHKARYLEKYGIPFLSAQISSKDFADDDIRTEIKSNLRNIGADGVGVFTENTKLDSLNVGAQGTNADFQGWLNYLDGTMAMLILGQTASSGDAGGFSEGQIQENVRRDIVRSDAKGLQETINNSIIKPLEWFKYGTKDMEFIIDAEPPEDLEKKSTLVQNLAAGEYRADRDWVEKTFNIPLEKIDPSKPPTPVAPAPIVPPTGLLPTDDNPVDAQSFDDNDEELFQVWYKKQAEKFNLHPNPDKREHYYDYRSAWKAGVEPDKDGHWPSTFKRDGHPRLYVNHDTGEGSATPKIGFTNTRTGEKVTAIKPLKTDDHPIDAQAFDVDVDAILTGSKLPDDIKNQLFGKTNKEVISILNNQLVSAIDIEATEVNEPEEMARVRDAVEVNLEEVKEEQAEETLVKPVVQVTEKVEIIEPKLIPAEEDKDEVTEDETVALKRTQALFKDIKTIDTLTETEKVELEKFIESDEKIAKRLRELSESGIPRLMAAQIIQANDKEQETLREQSKEVTDEISMRAKLSGLRTGTDRLTPYLQELEESDPERMKLFDKDKLKQYYDTQQKYFSQFKDINSLAEDVVLGSVTPKDAATQLLNATPEQKGAFYQFLLEQRQEHKENVATWAKPGEQLIRGTESIIDAFNGAIFGPQTLPLGLARNQILDDLATLKKRGITESSKKYGPIIRDLKLSLQQLDVTEEAEKVKIFDRAFEKQVNKVESELGIPIVDDVLTGGLNALEMAPPMAVTILGSMIPGVRESIPVTLSTMFWTVLSQQDMKNDMVVSGIDPKTANDLSWAMALPVAALEQLQIKWLTPKGLKSLNAVGPATFKSWLKRTGVNFGKQQAMENFTEAAQDSAMLLTKAYATHIDENADKFNWTEEMKDFLKSRVDVALSMLWLSGPSASMNAISDLSKVKDDAQLEQFSKDLLEALKTKEESGVELNDVEQSLMDNLGKNKSKPVAFREFLEGQETQVPVEVAPEVPSIQERGDIATLDEAFRQDLADIENNEDMSESEKDIAIKELTANFQSLKSQLLSDQKAEIDGDIATGDQPLDVTESIEEYISSLQKQINAYKELPADQQNDEVLAWMRAEVKQMKEGRRITPDQLLAIEKTPKKVSLNFSTYVLDRLKLRKKVASETRKEVVQNISDVQKALVEYISQQELPLSIKGKLITQLRDLSKFKSDEVRGESLKKAIARVDAVMESHEARVARATLKDRVSQLRKMALSPELKKLSDATLDSFNTTSSSESTRNALFAAMDFIQNPNKNRSGLLTELGMTETEASQAFGMEDGAKVPEAQLRESISKLRQAKVPTSLLEKLGSLSKTDLKDMTQDDINSIVATIDSIIHQQSRINQLRIANQRRAIDKSIVEATNNIAEDKSSIITNEELENDPIYKKLVKAPIKLQNQILAFNRQGFLTPSSMAFLLDGRKANGPIFKSLIQPLRDGYKNMYKVLRDANTPLQTLLQSDEIKLKGFDSKKGKNGTTYILESGENIKLSKNERIAILLHSQNPNNLRHLMTDGFVFGDNINKEVPIAMTHGDLSNILNDMTAEELKIAKQVSETYNTTLKNSLNSTSRDLNGYDLANEEMYFPIMTSALHRKYVDKSFSEGSTMEDMDAFNNFMIESQGFLKKRAPGAGNAIVLNDALKTFNKSINDVGRYHGFAGPLRQTKAFLRQRGSNGRTLAGVMNEKFEPRYWDSIKTLPTDIEQGKRVGKFGKATNAMLNRITRGVLGYNPGVAALQTISYAQALNEIPFKHWAKGATSKAAGYEEMGEHSPTLWARGQGKMSIAFGEATLNKASNLGMKGIQIMDQQAIGRIWRATESWVKEEMPNLEGDAFNKEVAKRAEHVVSETQPSFETIDRPQAARSSHFIPQILMRFSSQLIKNYGINFKNEQSFIHGDKNLENSTKFTKHILLNRIIVPLAVSLLRSGRDDIREEIMDMVGVRKRDDEEEEAFMTRLLAEMAGANLASQGQIVGQLWNILGRGFTPEEPLSGAVKDVKELIDDTISLADQISNDERYKTATKEHSIGDPKWKTSAIRLAWNLANRSNLTGLSLRNIAETGLAIPAVVSKVKRDTIPWIIEALEKYYEEQSEKGNEEVEGSIEHLNDIKDDLKLR